MKKRFAAAGLAAGLAGGAIAGIALTHPSISGAQTDTTTPSTTAARTRPRRARRSRPRPAGSQEALAPLVANGTITQSQADAVHRALEAARSRRWHRGPGFGRRLRASAPISTPLPLRSASARTTCAPALQSGQSLAEIAQAHGVTAQAVIDALVADAKAELDANG